MIAQKKNGYIQSGGFSFNIPKKIDNNHSIQYYKSIRGDKILKLQKKKVVLKIDVEGYESKVLLGMKNLLKNNKILLQIEIFDNNFKKVNKLLEKNKFKFVSKFKKTSDYFYINY
jgi:hypothetical protein